MELTRSPWPLGLSAFAVVASAVLAVASPALYAIMLVLLALAGLGFLVFLHPSLFVIAWLLTISSTLEMALLDLIGPAAFQTTIAAEKAVGLGLAAICAIRWGVRPDPLNPAWAFGAMAAFGLAVGLHPDLGREEFLRSVIGSMSPFAFCFCRIPRDRAVAWLDVLRWCPVLAVAMGVALALLGVRPLFVESGGLRLAGLGHPAFLAGVAMVGAYACLISTYRRRDASDRALLAVNLVILLATGARAPLACTALVIVLTLLFVRSDTVSAPHRVFALLAGACIVPVSFLLAGDLADIRVLNLLTTDAAHLSGRDQLWPLFEAAADGAPWFGWGIGAGNIVIPPDSAVAKLLKTWAAHNEYLRIRVEGGWVGLSLLLVLFAAWVVVRGQTLAHADRWIMRFVFLGFTLHAVTDNVLISTPACVLFTFVAAVFESGSAEGARRETTAPAPVRTRSPHPR